MTETTSRLFDRERLAERLQATMSARALTVRMAAREIAISPASVHRIASGGVPGVESFLRIKAWLEDHAG